MHACSTRCTCASCHPRRPRRRRRRAGYGDFAAVADAFKASYACVDEAILQRSRALGIADGTTALVALQKGEVLVVANAGDSRAVLCRGGQAVRLSRDHTPGVKARQHACACALSFEREWCF